MKESTVNFTEPSAPCRLRTQLTQYGFCRVVGAIGPRRLELLRNALMRLIADPPLEPGLTWSSDAYAGAPVVQRVSRANMYSVEIDRSIVRSAELRRIGAWSFSCAESEIRVATGHEGSDGVVAVIKDPRNATEHAELRWHRDDTFTSHLPINPFINCGLYLDDSTQDRGALVVYPPERPFPDGVGETIDEIDGQICASACAGDIVVHRSDVWHRSGKNRAAGTIRRVLYGNVFREAQ
jgi:hypothetical protein